MKRPGRGLDAYLDWTCDGFVVLFGLWAVLSQTVVLLGGNGLVLGRLSVLVPVLGAAILFLISRSSRRIPDPAPPDGRTPLPEPREASPDLPALAGAVLLSLFYVLTLQYILFWAGTLLFLGVYYALHLRAPLIRPHSIGTGAVEIAVFALLACVVLFLSLCVHRPHPDDSLYLSVAVDVHDHPEIRLMSRDSIHGIPGLPFLAPQHRLRTYDILVGQTARWLGIKPIAAAHLLFPCLFALIFLAAAARFLRLLLGRAWLYGLAAVVIFLAANGDVETTYGNSGLVLLFQGRGVLVTVMVPLLAAYGLEFMTGLRPAGAVWGLLLLGQAAALSFSTNALFIGPLAAGLSMAAAWRPNVRASLRLAAGALTCLYPLVLGLFLKTGSVPENFYLVSAPSWKFVAERSLNKVLGWRTFTAFWLTALLGGWTFLKDRPRRRWMLGFSFLFVLLCMNPALTSFWAAHITSVVTFFRLYWALPLPYFLAALLAGFVFAFERFRAERYRAALFAAALLAFAFFVPARWTFSSWNHARISRPGLKVPLTFYAVAEKLAESTPKGKLILAPETVAAWIPTIPGHPAAIGSRQMFLQQFWGRMKKEELLARRALLLYVGGAMRVFPTEEMNTKFAWAVEEFRIGSVAVTRSNPWGDDIALVLLGLGFARSPSPSRHFHIYIKT
ncbi:MAG: hypothetical protein JW747_08290 [Candidatus Aminicenantes bacterium]|nr:hypothetical protein [Candidatus Aminicenantes bacterium]